MTAKKIPDCDICVFFRAYNDIDHITPILYRLKLDSPNLKITVIMLEYKTNYYEDYRILFLNSLNIKFVSISDLGFFSTFLNNGYKRIRKTILSWNSSNMLRRVVTRFTIFYEKTIDSKINTIDPVLFLETKFDIKPKLFIFDQNNNSFYRKLAELSNSFGIKSIAVPHGHTILSNELHSNTLMEISLGESPFGDFMPYNYDFVVFENQLIADRYVRYGFLKGVQAKVIGSSRYSDEWMEKIPQIINTQSLKFGQKKKLKIVFMLSKITYNGFQAEIDRTVEFITKFKDVFLIVKPHTRYKRLEHKKKDNLFIDNKHEYHSPNLIDWADLIIFEHSCISFHALKKNKPTLYLSSTHANRLMSEDYFTSWEAKCRDDIRNTIYCLLKDKRYQTYEIQKAVGYIKKIIEPLGKDILGNYSNLILGLIND